LTGGGITNETFRVTLLQGEQAARASHNDVTSHVCYREFSIALNGAGHLVLT